MFKSMFTRKEGLGNPNTWLLYLLFFPWHQGPGHFVNVSVNLKNLPIYYIGLSFAKVLPKPWRKTAFIWRLGGLNCVGLLRLLCRSAAVWAWKCQNWPMKVSKDQNTMQKASNLNVQHCAATTEKLRWLICPRSCSILAWCTAKVKHGYGESLAKVNFYSAKMSFSAWKNLEQPSHIHTYIVHVYIDTYIYIYWHV